jgi:cell wall-associated NlpC family hydrolase
VPALLSLRSFARASLAAVCVVGAFGMSTASAATGRTTVTRAASGSVPAGQSLLMTASVHAGNKALAGVRVELFRIAPSGRVLAAKVTTDKAGSASAMVKPTATGRYYWRFDGTGSYGASGTRITVKVTRAVPVVVPIGVRILAEAARHIGAPYVYGATGPRSFDCSGLTQYVLARLGISLPRTAAEQYGAVRHVANGDKRIGDLIFFRLGGGGIDHVGIYAGNNQMVVAPKTGDHVRYEAIWTSYSVGRP